MIDETQGIFITRESDVIIQRLDEIQKETNTSLVNILMVLVREMLTGALGDTANALIKSISTPEFLKNELKGVPSLTQEQLDQIILDTFMVEAQKVKNQIRNI